MAADSEFSRREFLGALSAGVAVAGTLAATSEATAQSAAFLKIVDFHNHYISPSWNSDQCCHGACGRTGGAGKD